MSPLESETQLSITELMIDRNLDQIKKCLEKSEDLEEEHKEIIEEYQRDLMDLKERLEKYKNPNGRFRKLRQAKTVAGITKLTVSFKRKYNKEKNQLIDRILESVNQ